MTRHRTPARRHLPGRLGAAGLALVLLTGVSGCGKAAEKIGQKATEKAIESGADGNADVDISDGEMNIETEDGSFSVGSGEIPDSWPEDVPLPDGLEVLSAMDMGSDGESMINVSGTTDMTPDEVTAFYESGLDGWSESDSFSSRAEEGGMSSVSYEQDGRTVGVTILDDPDEATTLSLSYTVEAAE